MLQLPTKLTLESLQTPPNTINLSYVPPIDIVAFAADQRSKILIQSYVPIVRDVCYPEEFVNLFILVKGNAMARKECDVSGRFLERFVKLYKSDVVKQIYHSNNQAQILAQLLAKIDPNELSLTYEHIESILQGNALLAASAVWLLTKSQQYIKKQEFSFCLSFVALGGRQLAFMPIVHKQKNHAGQIYFANRINQLFQVNRKIIRQQIKVQDPYSMRCSPQVHGIAYDCFEELKGTVGNLINQPHCKYLYLNGKKIQNLLVQSQGFALKMDALVCCLQEIGAMSLLRTQRILNTYLGKNDMKSHQSYPLLLSTLKSCSSLASSNKLLSQATNFDTCNLNSYTQDIFYNPGQHYTKTQKLMNNLYYIMNIEILSSIEAMRGQHQGKVGTVDFLNQEMKEWVNWIQAKIGVWDRIGSLEVVKDLWKVAV